MLSDKLKRYRIKPEGVDWIPTGFDVVDAATGGGFPRGRIVEVFGPESSGKTTLLQKVIASAQSMNLECAYVDVEHALDLDHARHLGMDTDAAPILQPETAEEALEIVEEACTGGAGVVVVDSVAGMVTQAELEGSKAQAPIARLMSDQIRKIVQKAKQNNTCVVFINQLRRKTGVIFGSPEYTCGGEAIKYFASLRLDVRKAAWLKHVNKVVGFKSRVRAVKNKLSPPYREAYFCVTFDHESPDIGKLENLVLSGKAENLGGGYYKYEGKKFKASQMEKIE